MSKIYEIEAPNGTIVEIEGDREPTKAEAAKALSLAIPHEKSLGDTVVDGGGDLAAEVGGATVGQIIGTAAGPVGTVIGGAIGGAAGNVIKQVRQMARGEREDFSLGEMGGVAAVSAIPGSQLVKGGKTVAGTITRDAAVGAGLAVGQKTVETVIDKQELPSWGEVGFAAGGGLVFGGAISGLGQLGKTVVNALNGKSAAEAKPILEKAVANAANDADKAKLTELRDMIDARLGVGKAPKDAADSALAMSAEHPPAVKPASESAAALDSGLNEKERLAAQFTQAKAEQALQGAKDGQLAGSETIALGDDAAKNQLTAIETRPGESAKERARVEAKIAAGKPKFNDSISAKLSPQAQRVMDEYGFVAPKLAGALGGGGAGFITGISQDGTPEERMKRGAAFAVVGAAGGYMLGRTFSAATVPKVTPGQYPDLDRWYGHLSPPDKIPLAERIAAVPGRIREALVTKFAPLDRLESEIASANPGMAAFSSTLPLSRKFEQVAGASAKGLLDVHDFERNVLAEIRPEELRDFDVLLAAKRTGQRLQWNQALAIEQARIQGIPKGSRTADEVATLAKPADLKRVGSEDLPSVDRTLQQLEAKLGPTRFAELDQLAAGSFQQELDEVLRLQVAAGRLSPEGYAGIRASNDFYAPFRVLRAAERFDGPGTSGAIDTRKQLAHAIEGIDDPDFRLESPTKVAAEQIFAGRVLAEKNLKMLELAKLADLDASGTVIRKLRDGQEPRNGFQAVNYFEDGAPMRLEVDPAVARAIKGLNPEQTGVIGSFAQALGSVFRFGATSANLAFQARNLLAADQPRLLLLSKYGAQLDPREAFQIPMDFAQALYSSIMRNVGGKETELSRAFYESGAAGSTLQDAIARIGGRVDAENVAQAAVRGGRGVIDTIQDLARVLEETTKMMGFKRGIRIEGLEALPPAQAAAKLEEIVTEVRNFAGSPDFARHGGLAKDLNMAFIFFNARLQGVAGDVTRMVGGDGAKVARDAWIRLGATAGVASAYFWFRNQDPENKADFEKLSDRDRENFIWIPRYGDDGAPLYGTDAEGAKFREYFTIPKRESAKTISNLTAAALDFAASKQPDAVARFGINFVEDISPINISGRNGTERVESAIGNLNPLLRVPYEVIANRDTFRHAPVVPASRQGGGDPTLQYFPGRTPDLYVKAAKLMPRAIWNPMRSPLMLQQTVQGLTGGLVGQFTRRTEQGVQRDPVASGLAGNPATKMFVGSTYRNNGDGEGIARDVRAQATDARISRDNEALAEFEAMQAMAAPERRTHAEKLAAETPELFSAVLDEFEKHQKGFDGADRIAAGLGVRDGARAEYLRRRIDRMPAPERRPFIESQIEKGIITDEVWEQMLGAVHP